MLLDHTTGKTSNMTAAGGKRAGHLTAMMESGCTLIFFYFLQGSELQSSRICLVRSNGEGFLISDGELTQSVVSMLTKISILDVLLMSAQLMTRMCV